MKGAVAPHARLIGGASPAALAVALLILVYGFDARGDEQATMALGKRIFTEIAQPSCVICHRLQEAGSTGDVGPNLDELKPDPERVAQAVKYGLGVMPAYGESLTEEQIQAVAQYVARASGGTAQLK